MAGLSPAVGQFRAQGGEVDGLVLHFPGAQGGEATEIGQLPLHLGRQGEASGQLRNAAPARGEGIDLVITVDCGTTAVEALEAARDAGLDVIVVDHHAAEPQLPPAVAVVNPNRLDEASPHRQLAAVGVTFLLVVALNRALRQAGWYRDAGPDLYVSRGLGTSVVPLRLGSVPEIACFDWTK